MTVEKAAAGRARRGRKGARQKKLRGKRAVEEQVDGETGCLFVSRAVGYAGNRQLYDDRHASRMCFYG
jgi:hypothetical protein